MSYGRSLNEMLLTGMRLLEKKYGVVQCKQLNLNQMKYCSTPWTIFKSKQY